MITHDLVGSSPKFQAVLEKVNIVASVDSTVLLRGETGTGKEVIAQAIHNASTRRYNRFVALNCAAVPATLLESELFGHERGAFTGAVTQTAGRFQAADRGTFFLDEIGDLPLELQPKLLRVLQERQVERLGSGHTTQIDVRVIAATNQDLWSMVQENRFRPDLYYRLNVFPIDLPPLRERKEDIQVLAQHFIHKFAERHHKAIDCIPEELTSALQNYDWPGNIRELQNVTERVVIMNGTSALSSLTAELTRSTTISNSNATLTEAERNYIIKTLHETNWVVGGRNGAAARLGLPRTTLIAKMRKLGISREVIECHMRQRDVVGDPTGSPSSAHCDDSGNVVESATFKRDFSERHVVAAVSF